MQISYGEVIRLVGQYYIYDRDGRDLLYLLFFGNDRPYQTFKSFYRPKELEIEFYRL